MRNQAKRVRIGELLLEQGILSQEQLTRLAETQMRQERLEMI